MDVARQWLKSGIAGGISALVNIAVLYALTEWMDIYYLFSSMFAFIAALIINFVLQKYWVFPESAQGNTSKQLWKYTMLVATNFVLNGIGLYFLTEVIGTWYILSQVIVTLTLFVMNFLIGKKIIFTTNT